MQFDIPVATHQATTGARRTFLEIFGHEFDGPDEWLRTLAVRPEIKYHRPGDGSRCKKFIVLMQECEEWAARTFGRAA